MKIFLLDNIGNKLPSDSDRDNDIEDVPNTTILINYIQILKKQISLLCTSPLWEQSNMTLAEYATDILNADIYEIVSKDTTYTDTDLAYYTGGRADKSKMIRLLALLYIRKCIEYGGL